MTPRQKQLEVAVQKFVKLMSTYDRKYLTSEDRTLIEEMELALTTEDVPSSSIDVLQRRVQELEQTIKEMSEAKYW